jgi:DNA-binding transcriptional LysR family regulator
MQIDDFKLIDIIAKFNSFAEAADHLGMSRPNASKRIKQIESQLGVKIFKRTTRSLSITEQGEEVVRRARQIVTEMEELNGYIQQEAEEPSGHLMIDAIDLTSTVICQYVLDDFVRRFPNVNLSIKNSSQQPESVKWQADVIVHIKALESKSFICDPIASCRRIYVATPQYLARRGRPTHPSQLNDFDCILAGYGYSAQTSHEWSYEERGEIHNQVVNGAFSFDEIESGLIMTLRHHGISWLPGFLCEPFIARGELVEVFEGQFCYEDTVYAIYPKAEMLPLKTQVFVEALKQKVPQAFRDYAKANPCSAALNASPL